MKLYIQIQDNQPINHPAFEDNLIEAFGEIPDNWEPFIRVQCPMLEVYETLNSEIPAYEKIGNDWTDVWTIRPMTNEEKYAKQQLVKNAFNLQEQAENWSTWLFDEITCSMQPPIPRPNLNEGQIMFWCGAENSWKESPIYPDDGNQYKFDYKTWSWVVL